MIFNTKLTILLSVMILISSLLIYGKAFPQSIELNLDLQDLKEWDKQTQEYPKLKELVEEQKKTIAELEKSLAIAQREMDLEKRENELNLRIIAIKDQEIAGLNRNFDQMKEVADRAIKLAEVSKPKSNWQLQGLLGVAAFAIGLLINR